MKPLERLRNASTKSGPLTLLRRGADFIIQLDGEDLMLSRLNGSERDLARLAIAEVRRPGPLRVLVGGLGMGFTLRAALDALDDRPGSSVVVSEAFGAVLEWNEELLGSLAGYPLDDPRTSVRIEDVRESLHAAPGTWDVAVLDVDNGPSAFTLSSNESLYRPASLRRTADALAPGGVFGVWSADPDPGFVRELAAAGLSARAETVSARVGGKGARHTIFLGTKTGRRAGGGSRRP